MRYPSDDNLGVRILRFINVLDDDRNELSPTKMHVWSANASAWISFVVTVICAFFKHAADALPVIGAATGYMVHAHSARLADKKERNRASEESDRAFVDFNRTQGK